MDPADVRARSSIATRSGDVPGSGQSDPLSLLTTMIAAVNAHDIERSSASFSDDVTLTLRPEFPSLRDRTHHGRPYVRKWLQGLFDRDFRIEIAVEKSAGNEIRTRTTTWMTTTRRLGVAPVVGFEDYVFEDGKITSLTWTSSDQTRRKVIAMRKRLFVAASLAAVLFIVSTWWFLAR